MITLLHYSTRMTFLVHGLGATAVVEHDPMSLNEALDFAQAIYDDSTMFNSDCINMIDIIDATTGELIAECKPEPKENPAFNEDWDFNEDEGFDPYEGCYTYDC